MALLTVQFDVPDILVDLIKEALADGKNRVHLRQALRREFCHQLQVPPAYRPRIDVLLPSMLADDQLMTFLDSLEVSDEDV